MIDPRTALLQQTAPPINKKKKVIVISGPTGVGKTKLSLRIAPVIGGEIISADSMQVYRGMDIGTAKVTSKERHYIRHHLIDSRDLDEPFNVVHFFDEAQQALKEIFFRNHVPIVVGGTGFYLHTLIYGPPQGPSSVPEIREKFQKEMEEKGSLFLYQRLKEMDPTYAKTITPHDQYKIIRALEIMELTNQKVSSFQRNTSPYQEVNFRCWFLYMPKELLYPLLDKRCEEIIANGFIDEVKRLEEYGIRQNPTASRAIGYRQCLEFLLSPQSSDDLLSFIKDFKRATRRYVKRQLTWFHNEPLFKWLHIDKVGIEKAVELIIQDYEQS